MTALQRNLFWSGILANVLVLSLAARTVPVSWDEGWNFCVARYWVEEGFWGCKYMGEPAIAGLSNGPVTVSLVALGFKLWGVGIVPGRLFFALSTITLLGLICVFTYKVFRASAACLVPWVFLVLSGDQRINPLFLGGQAWGEIPALLLVFIGILCLYSIQTTRNFVTALVCCPIVFSLAIFTKPQFSPFIIAALSISLLFTLTQKNVRGSVILLVSIVISIRASDWWLLFALPYPLQTSINEESLPSITAVLATNFDPHVRLANLQIFLREGLLVTIAIIGIFISKQKRILNLLREHLGLVVLLSIAFTWIGWFLTLSINFPRYLAPALVMLIPVASYGASSIRISRVQIQKKSATGFLVISVLVLFGLANLKVLYCFLSDFWDSNTQLLKVAKFLNEETPNNTVVETYETQLFFLVNRNLSYPSDSENFQMMRGELTSIANYNPLRNNPNYIVLGLWSENAFPFYRKITLNSQNVKTYGDFKVITVAND